MTVPSSYNASCSPSPRYGGGGGGGGYGGNRGGGGGYGNRGHGGGGGGYGNRGHGGGGGGGGGGRWKHHSVQAYDRSTKPNARLEAELFDSKDGQV